MEGTRAAQRSPEGLLPQLLARDAEGVKETVMNKIELGFDPREVWKELQDEEPDEDGVVRVFLGTVFSLYPSGKYYTPFANGNVAACPCCHGSGKDHSVKRRIAKKWLAAESRKRRQWVKTYGPARAEDGRWGWPEAVRKESDAWTRKTNRYKKGCARCGGLGSAEAHDDERWNELAEEALGKYGVSLSSGEGDPCDIIAEMTLESGDEGDGGPAEPEWTPEDSAYVRKKIDDALRESQEGRAA